MATQLDTITEEILYINPSKENPFSKIYLSEDELSWITIEWLSEELIAYATTHYQQLFDLHPKDRGKVVMYDNQEVISPRWHRSYLHQPKRELNQKGTYMYSGVDNFEDLSLPTPFQPFLDFLNKDQKTHQYNQIIANWYANGKDFIAPHSDCEKEMIPNADITIITLCEDENAPREFKITPKKIKNENYLNNNSLKHVKIKMKHGCIITMGGETQKKFKHSIPKDMNNLSARISLTFRKF